MIDAWLDTKITMLTARVTAGQTTARQNSNRWPNKYALCFSNAQFAWGPSHGKQNPEHLSQSESSHAKREAVTLISSKYH